MFKIWMDAGHGGDDPGAAANGLKEKNITLTLANVTRAFILSHYVGCEVKTSRENDKTMSLQERTAAANKWGADLFISFHVNAGGGRGFESFIYNGNVSARTIAAQNMIHSEIIAAMRKFGDIPDRKKKRANFFVLRESDMSAILTETLFIDTASDANYLKKDEFITAIGQAHAVGIAKFLGLKSLPPPQPQPLYTVQIGAFKQKSNADKILKEAQAAGFIDAYIKIKE